MCSYVRTRTIGRIYSKFGIKNLHEKLSGEFNFGSYELGLVVFGDLLTFN
jgi:hypothetical protein